MNASFAHAADCLHGEQFVCASAVGDVLPRGSDECNHFFDSLEAWEGGLQADTLSKGFGELEGGLSIDEFLGASVAAPVAPAPITGGPGSRRAKIHATEAEKKDPKYVRKRSKNTVAARKSRIKAKMMECLKNAANGVWPTREKYLTESPLPEIEE